MPCYATGSAEGDAQLSAREARQEATENARAACDALAVLEQFVEFNQLKPATQRWWRRHKKIDRERRADEAARKNRKEVRQRGLSKLTAEEREELGL